MRFSVIVVSYNAGEKLRNTLLSVLEQDFEDYEIIVQDGESKDGSLDSIPEDGRILVYREKDNGIYDAMNRAAGKAAGEYVIFLNCGDYFYDREVLSKVDVCITGQPGAGIYYGNIYAEAVDSFIASNPKIDAFACYRNLPCHQACFYEARLLKKKEFDVRYKVRADYEQFLWCYFKGGVSPCYLNLTVASYEGGGYSETAENKRISAAEHKEITGKYMTPSQRLRYQAVLLATLAPLRSKIAENPRLSKGYNRLKKLLYH